MVNTKITPRQRVEIALRGGHGQKVPFTMYENKVPQCAAEREMRNRGMCIINRKTNVFKTHRPNVKVLQEVFYEDDKRMVRGIFRLYRSLTFKTTTASTWGMSSAVDQHVFGTVWETDDVEVEIPGDAKKNPTFKVVGNDAYPLSIQAMMIEIDAGEA